MVTVWSKQAKAELQKAYEYIFQDSPLNAAKVRDEIIDITIDLPNHPKKYPPDKYKLANDSNWRAFEKHHFRVSYRIMPNEIRIIRLRHTGRNPLSY
ncbi:Plasmid stabilization system protein ParE [Chitinophaga sp. YR573]|uniref:type II toxin-antitoxin system RelE/ParE family toxin n=1 Tax=Chitinophaga sp. YR573 TaxID=1881040 RepID=UPI0008D74E2C|nr:type II toxin-antitoxin system RelE/ParE family toxin [Chitinophaga sp. YR573]SEW44752.1 Plasmid stabilization system protein ParE [Chitinophaga sp. YR573]